MVTRRITIIFPEAETGYEAALRRLLWSRYVASIRPANFKVVRGDW